MNKKKLPKAIRPVPDDIGETAAGPEAGTPQQVRAHSTNSDALIESEVTRSDTGRASNGVGTAPQTPPPPVAHAVVRATPTTSEFDAERRRLLAYAIVERHAAYSAVGGIIPLPIVNLASITAIIVRMVKELCEIYGVSFERDRARAIVIGLMGGATPTGLSAVTASTLVYIMPGANLIGLAVSSAAGFAFTRSIGRLLIDRFESGATLHQFATPDRTATS
jgi:uncharacterized protein (DUF697 family)